ncbi:MAG: cyclic nucleotide-binding domain-containing protein [Candidatus Wallbacteria bacterium]|nr:cyclic nucleotide-binding domain-containing protein [Candidatus Wallbacteria bacterium]
MKENPYFHRVLQNAKQRDGYVEQLRETPLFYGLSDDECLALLQASHYVIYEPGELIFSEGETGRTLHLVIAGLTLVGRPQAPGGRCLAELGPGKIVGEIAFFCGTPRTASAHAGPKGTEHLVLTSEMMLEVNSQRPRLFQSVLHSLIEAIGKRLQRLPPVYRSYILFGYLPERSGIGKPDLQLAGRMHPLVYGLLGGTYGFFLGLLVILLLGETYPTLKEARGAIALACEISAFLCGLVGFVTGVVLNYLGHMKQRQQTSDRNCGNCKFVAWDARGERFDCLLLLSGAASPTVRPGQRHDTYTDCSSFELRPFGEVTARKRDTMSNLD